MKKAMAILLVTCLLASLLAGCAGETKYKKYQSDFMDTFDTVVIVMAYTQTQEQFDELTAIAHDEFVNMHRLFDIYHSYDGINNVKTINDNAGVQPV